MGRDSVRVDRSRNMGQTLSHPSLDTDSEAVLSCSDATDRFIHYDTENRTCIHLNDKILRFTLDSIHYCSHNIIRYSSNIKTENVLGFIFTFIFAPTADQFTLLSLCTCKNRKRT
jgi:hypothetical protein